MLENGRVLCWSDTEQVTEVMMTGAKVDASSLPGVKKLNLGQKYK